MIKNSDLLCNLVVTAFLMLFSTSALSESLFKMNKPVKNDEYHSLSAPSSDPSLNRSDREEFKKGNLSARVSSSSSTNNAPFSGKEKNRYYSNSHSKAH